MSSWNETAWFAVFMGAALKGTLALAVAWLFAWLLRGRSAAARHLVWTGAAVVVIALPLLSVSLPALRLPATSVLLPAVSFVVDATAPTAPHQAMLPRNTNGPVSAPRLPIRRTPDWRIGVISIWTAGIGIAVAQMLLAFAVMWRVRRTARQLGVQDGVDVLETARGGMPMTFGFLRPAIFLPMGSGEWGEERRRIVLLHELAHVRRGDVATHFLARLALSLYWWNPLAWLAWREFLKERERATDDLVLAAGVRASDYGGHLLEVARAMRPSAGISCAAVAMARRSQLEGRLLAILDTRVNRSAPGRGAGWLVALLAAALAAPLAMVRAQDAPPQATPLDVTFAVQAAASQKDNKRLDEAAKAAEQQRKYDIAHTLLEGSLAIRGQVSGQQSEAYGIGLMKLGDLEKQRSKRESAAEFYAKAVQVLGDKPEAWRALMFLGMAAVPKGQFAEADGYFMRAQHADPSRAGLATTWMALVEERKQNPGEAERLYQEALSIEGGKSDDAPTTMALYARLLRGQDRIDEAKDLDTRAAAVRSESMMTQIKAQAKADGVSRVGGAVKPPKLLKKEEPEYSMEANVAKLQGTVVVSVEVGVDGLAHNMQVLRGLGLGLDENAIAAISQWQFQPGTRDGQPVPVLATIEVNFRLL